MTDTIKLKNVIEVSINVQDISNIPENVTKKLLIIGNNSYKFKGVYTVLTTLLLYKINVPNQDIRYHQTKQKNGFSGRTYDTKEVTPVLREMGFPAMSESGWLTRSLEQSEPYLLTYKGEISRTVKMPFLELLDYVQKNPHKALDMLRLLTNAVYNLIQSNQIKISPLQNPDKLTIDKIIDALTEHFNYKYHIHHGAKLPVLAFYAIYKSIIREIKRYEKCYLSPLSSLTACDLTSKASGDIEIFQNNRVFESIEIKLGKQIDSHIVRIVEDKIYKFNPERYYILSSSGINNNDKDEIFAIVDRVKENHGCQIIVNGLIPTLKYYLRLISSLDLFILEYNSLVENDNEIQKIHKEVWNDIISKI